MNPLDRTIVRVGMLALAVCVVGVLRAENPRAGKGTPAPVPLALNLRRPPPCTPRDSAAPRPRPVAELPAYRGGDERIVAVPNPCLRPATERDAAAAMQRLREDLGRIQVLREAAARPARP